MTKPIRVHIRWMIRRDYPEVLAIDADSFEFPWPEREFLRCLRQRNANALVAEYDDRVIAFMVYEYHERTVRILNFAVAADCRRRGVGSQMVAKLKAKLSAQRRNRLVLEVRETNAPAQRFFARCGFRATAVLRGFYDEAQTSDDAYVMQYGFGEQWQPRNRISKWLQEARHDAGGGQGQGSTDGRPQ